MPRKHGSSAAAVAKRIATADDLLRRGVFPEHVVDHLSRRYRVCARQARRYVAAVFRRWKAEEPGDLWGVIEAERDLIRAMDSEFSHPVEVERAIGRLARQDDQHEQARWRVLSRTLGELAGAVSSNNADAAREAATTMQDILRGGPLRPRDSNH